jgi:murein hydrolase activator
MRRTALLGLLCCIAAFVATAQSTIDERRKDLDRLRQSIEQTRKRIDALNRRESSAMRSLTSAQRQQHRLTSFIASLEADLRALQDSAATLSTQISTTKSSLERVERSYNDATTKLFELRAAQRGGQPRSAATTELYRQMSRSVATYRRNMLDLQDSLAAQRSLLDAYAQTQASIKSSKEQEQQRLASAITGSRKELQRLRTDKTALVKELRQKQQSASRLRSMINALVAREERSRRQRAEAAKRDREATPGRSTPAQRTEDGDEVVTGGPPSGGYGARSLPWPTSSRQLMHGYGTYTNRETGVVFDNPGIDIKAPIGTNVLCVGGGVVSSVSWLPGFGSLVIVDHRNGFRSVYANLATVSVREGTSVRAGSLMGTSGESVDGALVHFELWRGRERVDPTRYLR